MALTTWDIGVCAVVAVLVYSLSVMKKKSSLPYPPGPQGYPIVGNLGFPGNPLWKKVQAMSEKYGTAFLFRWWLRLLTRNA